MVLDFNSFRARGPRLRFGAQDFGVPSLTPGQVAGARQSPRTTPMHGTLPEAEGWTWNPQPGSWDLNTPAAESLRQVTGAPPPMNYQMAAPEAVGLSGGATTNTTGLNNGGATGLSNGVVTPTPGLNNGTGGQRFSDGSYRVNTPSAYGKPNGYFYNGHSGQAGDGQWIQLPVQYNEAADTKRWEYNGTDQESTMRRAVRYAFDDMRDGRSKDFNAALMARLTQFYNEAGGKNVGYALNTVSPSGSPTMPGTTPGTDPTTGTPPGTQPGTGGGNAGTDDAIAAFMDDPKLAFREMLRRRGYSNPNMGGLAMQFLKDRYEPALGAMSEAASGMDDLGGTLGTETFDQFMNQVAQGGLGRNARNIAHNAYDAANAHGYLEGSPDQAVKAYYENLNYLNTLASGGLVQQAMQSRLQRYWDEYTDAAVGTLRGDMSQPQSFQDFMNRRRYSMFR